MASAEDTLTCTDVDFREFLSEMFEGSLEGAEHAAKGGTPAYAADAFSPSEKSHLLSLVRFACERCESGCNCSQEPASAAHPTTGETGPPTLTAECGADAAEQLQQQLQAKTLEEAKKHAQIQQLEFELEQASPSAHALRCFGIGNWPP